MENLIIIGSGCAGLSAAIYSARAGLNPLVIEGKNSGGQIISTDLIENYAGTKGGISGVELVMNMRETAEKFGARFLSAEVLRVDFSNSPKKIFCESSELEAEKVIVATGASARLTGAKNENILYGRGVSVCATCDGAFYRNKDVAIIGGGDSAFSEALFLSKFAKSVKIIHRRDTFRATKVLVDSVLKNPKISLILNSVVEEFLLDENKKCAGVRIKNLKNFELQDVHADGVFLAIGHTPNTSIFKGQLELDEGGYIKTYGDNFSTKTSVKNVFAAGDCVDKTYRQAIIASAFGCIASLSILA